MEHNFLALDIDEEALVNALQASGSYIVYSENRDGMLYTPEMSRRARVVELWATLKYLGKSGIDELVYGDYYVNGSGRVVRQASNILRYVQTGSMQFYALFISAIVVLFGLYKFEIAFMDLGWPTVTIVFVLGVSLLTLLSRIVTSRYETDQEAEGEE